jgi:hypothetical protein
MTMTKTELTLEDVTKPTIRTFDRVFRWIVGLSGITFAIIYAFTAALGPLVLAGVALAWMILNTLALSLAVAEDNQKRLDYLIQNL